jgi:hypothetical protein
VEIKKDYGWLTAKDFADQNPQRLSIMEVLKTPDGKIQLCGVAHGKLKKTDIFGDMQNALVEKFGEDSSKWIGKETVIKREERIGEKARRIFT